MNGDKAELSNWAFSLLWIWFDWVCLSVCIYVYGGGKERKRGRVAISPPLCRAASLELGWDMQIQSVCLPAPSEAAEQHAASCTHTLTYAECRGLEGSSLVSRSHTCLRMCVCVSVRSWNFPRDTLAHSSLLSSVLLSSFSFPLLQHTFVLFSLPLFLSPPSSATTFPSALSCVLRLWLVCELRECWVRCCWCYSCLGSMSPSGPAEEDKTAREPGNFNTALWETCIFFFFFLASQLNSQDSGINWAFKDLEKKEITMRTKLCQVFAQFFLLGVLLSVVDSKGTFYGGHVNPFYGNRYNLYKAELNPHHSPNKPMTRHK